MYKPVLLLALLPNMLLAAAPGITLQVSSETAPPGGYAQFKISLTAPTLVSSASVSMNFDSAIFGNIASVAAFSATGDQTGYATPHGLNVLASFTSLSAGFGQLPDLPIFVVTVPVLATAKIGATSSITVDPTHSPWQPGGTVNVNPGTFTVGGALSIQNVTPGGGLLPSGTVVTINGTGFDATTMVTIDGVSLASTQLISAQEVAVTLGGATEMTGKHVRVSTPAGESVDYFASLPNTITGSYVNGNVLILPSLPSPAYTAVQWNFDPDTGLVQWYSCLQNPNSFPVTAIYYTANPTQAATSQSVVIPPYGQYIAFTYGGIGSVYMTASAPLRMAQAVDYTGDPAAEEHRVSVSPAPQMTSLGNFGIELSANSHGAWTWQLGAPAPAPQTVSLFSGAPFTLSVSAGASAWLNVTPASGNPGFTMLTLTPVVSNLAEGTYTGTVTLTPQLPPDLAQFAPGSVSIAVTLTVTAQPLLLSDGGSTVPFSMVLGGSTPSTQTYVVMTNGSPAAFTAAVVPNSGTWLSVTPSSGTAPATLTLAVNPVGLTAGTYQSAFLIQGPINTLNVAVTLTISNPGPGSLVVSPASLTFSLTPGEAAPSQPQFIAVHTPTPQITVSISTQSGAGWLTAALAGTAGANVNATAVNLGPGTYQGTVTIASPLNLVATVPVTLVVASPPGPAQLAVSTLGITLTATAGTTARTSLNVTPISGAPVFSIATSNNPALNLQVQGPPASATGQFVAPATLQVSVAAVLPGTYLGSITITWNGGSSTVPVLLYATPMPATPPVTTYIVNSGSEIPGSISPGELITIFGSGLGGQPASLQLNSDLTAKTTLGGTQVLINSVPAPMIFTSTGQLNAIVPYEVGTSDAASIQVVSQGILSSAWAVPVVPAAPSILTSGGAGVGQGAIVNQDNSRNYETNPAPRGTVIEIYTTGGGQTSPLSTTGSVARVAANLTLPVSVTIGGVDAHVLYAGNAPGEIEGVVQINVMVPPTVTQGTLPVVVTIGGVASPPGVTVSVQ